MNLDKQRIAIAEACGWTGLLEEVVSYGVSHGGRARCEVIGFAPEDRDADDVLVRQVDGRWLRVTPNYPGDLNAMHEAEKVLNAQQVSDYIGQLCDVMPAEFGIAGALVHASAAQRAEAFLKAIGKWEGE